MRFSELLSRSCRCGALIGKPQKMLDRISLKDLSDGVMYAKIRAKNWATLFEIAPSTEPKIKSVAQFNLTLIRVPDWKTTVIFSPLLGVMAVCTS